MTDYLLCVLIVTVAYFVDVFTRGPHTPDSERPEPERQPLGYVVLAGLMVGGVLYGLLYGLLKLFGWLITKYGGGLV